MMSSRTLVVVLALLCCMLQLFNESNAACVCNEHGKDHCAPCNEHIVRPKAKQYETYVDLPPIGDNCWCNKHLIEPAALPKPCEKVREAMEFMCALNNLIKRKLVEVAITAKHHCISRLRRKLNRLEQHEDAQIFETHKTPYCKCKQEKSYHNEKHENNYDNSYPAFNGGYDSPTYNNPPVNYYSPSESAKYDSPAADPVSVSLAIQAGKTIGVPEAKLAFGFVQKPLDGLQKIEFSNIPEENLFKLQNEVITLKKRPSASKRDEEEILVEEEEEEEGSADDDERPHLTYKQLGYETEEFKNPKFRKISSSYVYPEEKSYDYKPVYESTKVDCGFRPGRVAYGKESKKTDCYTKQ